MAIARIHELAENVVDRKSPEFREILVNCTQTAVICYTKKRFFCFCLSDFDLYFRSLLQMNSKLIASHREFFAEMVVDTVLLLDEQGAIDDIGVKKVKFFEIAHFFPFFLLFNIEMMIHF